MTMVYENAIVALNRDYLDRFIKEAARTLSRTSSDEIASVLKDMPIIESIHLWGHLHPDIIENLLDKISEDKLRQYFTHSEPVTVSRMISRLPKEKQQSCMSLLSSEKQSEIRARRCDRSIG